MCNCNDSYTIAKRRITVIVTNNAKTRNKKVAFKNNALFWAYISKINNTFIDNPEDFPWLLKMADVSNS